MSKGRFLYVGGFKLPDKNAAAHRVVGVAKILHTLGYDVVLLGETDDLDSVMTSEPLTYFGFETYAVHSPQSIAQWGKRTICATGVNEVLNKHDDWIAVIAYNYSAIALANLIQICKKRRIKVLGDCTEWYMPDTPNKVRYIATRLDTSLRMRCIHKYVDGMIVISSYLSRYYEKAKLPILLLPPTIDRSTFPFRNREGKQDGLKIVYAGSPGRNKDKIQVIVHSICEKGGSGFVLLVVGITKEQYLIYYPEDSALLSMLDTNKRVVFLGTKSHRETLQILCSADFSIFYREVTRATMAGFPTKLVESISCGIPVITNQTSDIADYIREGKNGILLSTDDFQNDLTRLLHTIGQADIIVESDVFDYKRFVEITDRWIEEWK